MKNLKKVIAIIASVACTFMAVLAFSGCKKNEVDTRPVVELYMIAGQSNASGSSLINSGTIKVEDKNYEDVWFAGETNKYLDSAYLVNPKFIGCANANTYLTEFTTVRLGLGGNDDGRLGPEFGMADTLSSFYADRDAQPMIFKSAAGGTSITNRNDGNSRKFGNWYPRSLWTDENTNESTGGQYKKFVDNLKIVYSKLVRDGYRPKIMGLCWLQGESDREDPANYKTIFTQFIKDIRKDVEEITGENQSKMPIAISALSPTYNSPEERYWAINTAFNAMLHDVAENSGFDAVSVQDNPDLLVWDYDCNQLAPDAHHYVASDMVKLGKRLASRLIDMNGLSA